MDIEFVLSVFVFVIVIGFVSMIIISNVPLLRSSALSDDLKARAYQVSYQITFYKGLNAAGNGNNWNDADVSQVGLASDRYDLSLIKINELNELCASSYERFRDLVAQDFKRVVIVNVSTTTTLAYCAPQKITIVNPEFQISRFALIGTNVARVTVSVL